MTACFNVAFAAYLAALVFGGVSLVSRRRWASLAFSGLLALGAAVQTAYIVLRWKEAGRAPFSNMFESLVLFAWAVAVIYLCVLRRVRFKALDAAAALLVVLTLAYSSFFESDIRPLMPALQSNWLAFHVFTCFLGYGGFAISFVASIAFLIVNRQASPAGREPRDTLDYVMGRTIAFGFLFLSLGIITGSVWANSAWGSYWSWDPKETWSLITWVIYAVYLHCRFMRGWTGNRAAWISVAGFLAVIFTYIGVNFLLAGLHSYA